MKDWPFLLGKSRPRLVVPAFSTNDHERENTLDADNVMGHYDLVNNVRYNLRGQMTFLDRGGFDTEYSYWDNPITGNIYTGNSHNDGRLGNLSSYDGISYDYLNWSEKCETIPSPALPHAVRQAGTDYFCYDDNGNMTTRADGSTVYTHIYDVENRLTEVTSDTDDTVTTFYYDAAGQRTRTVVDTPLVGKTITYYPFPNYEEEEQYEWQYVCGFGGCDYNLVLVGTVKRSTYSLAGQAIATRITDDPNTSNNGLFYFLTDHLGSTTMLTNSSGTPQSSTTAYHLPFGDYRSTPSGNDLTERGFTGHHENRDIGLTYMNARFYVVGLAHFLTADTLVPDPTNPQGFNRYSYVLGNPMRLIDSTGHYGEDVHYQLTWDAAYTAFYNEGINRGLTNNAADMLATDLATQIAEADQGLDQVNVLPYPVGNAVQFLFGEESSRKLDTPHWRNRTQAVSAVEQAITTANPENFGEALHGLQDYWSHFANGFMVGTGQDRKTLYLLEYQNDLLMGWDLLAEVEHPKGYNMEQLADNAATYNGHVGQSWADAYNGDALDQKMYLDTYVYSADFAGQWFDQNEGDLAIDLYEHFWRRIE